MSRVNIKSLFRSAFFICILISAGCNKTDSQVSGYLEGKISIGPLCPAETDPPNPACLPTAETYKAYPVSIWTSNGKRKIATISPALDGSYKVALDPGTYQIMLDKVQSAIGGSNLQIEVTVVSQEVTILNINIDTGIR
jgi:hypothetical protein